MEAFEQFDIPLQAKPNEYSVSEISQALKLTVEENFSGVRIRGEISGYKVAPSGHVYFNLKDQDSLLASVCWKGVAQNFNFKPEDGMEVICTGNISTYPARSSYQLIVSKMEIAGVGALLALLEKRKKMLEAEGLFSESRKQLLPFLPLTIGVITSPTGAVIRDILHRISDRFPVHVMVWPTLVQGLEAADQIVAAIDGFNSLSQGIQTPDLLILARGGGSLEDLMPFNEESVVRAVARSNLPIISAVGHETDTTLVDYASDKRAPTPTGAAEMAVPVRADLEATISGYAYRINIALPNFIETLASKISRSELSLSKFKNKLNEHIHKIEQSGMRLKEYLNKLLHQKIQKFHIVSSKLNIRLIAKDIERLSYELNNTMGTLNYCMKSAIENAKVRLENSHKLLESYHYKKALKRGFALVWGKGGEVLTSKAQLNQTSSAEIEFHDGKQRVYVNSKKPSRAQAPTQQPTLFDG